MASFTKVFEVSSKAFLARILDKESAETFGSNSFAIVGFGNSTIGSTIVVGVSRTTSVTVSIISGEGITGVLVFVSSTFSLAELLWTTSTIE
jgi:hypothetical protein